MKPRRLNVDCDGAIDGNAVISPMVEDENGAYVEYSEIAVALNSFEAMREALKELVKIYCPAQAGYSEATINAWINAEQALALAEGKAVQS